jgi:hypothetical protein
MAKATSLVQRVLGFSFLAFGLNGFVRFIPPLKMRNPALEFFIGLAATGYMLPMLYMTQAAAGALLLVGLWVPLALAILAPIVINILLFRLTGVVVPRRLRPDAASAGDSRSARSRRGRA